MLRQPAESHLFARCPELGLGRPLDVLLVDRQPGTPASLDDVLGAHADIRGVADGPVQAVRTGRRLLIGAREANLLGSYADRGLARAVDQARRHPDARV